MNVYENCPVLESEKYLLRLVKTDDVNDLLEVYGDKNALPFFNSDNCSGDNFYYPTKEKMEAAVGFWLYSYEKKWFVRWAIIDKTASMAIGTIEMFHRTAEDDFKAAPHNSRRTPCLHIVPSLCPKISTHTSVCELIICTH